MAAAFRNPILNLNMSKNWSVRLSEAAIGVFATVCLVGQAIGQTPPLKGGSAAPSTGGPTSAAAPAEINKILASERWKKVQAEFEKWLSVQVIYTPSQVDDLKKKLAAQVQKMSPAEIEQFLDQWDAKLKVLLSPDAADAREWLGQYLSVIANGRRQEFLERLGINKDVSKLTAAQIEDQINAIRAKRLAFQQQRAGFEAGRQQSLQMAEQFQNEQREVLQQSGAGQAAGYGTYQSQFAPRQYNWQPLPPIVPFFW